MDNLFGTILGILIIVGIVAIFIYSRKLKKAPQEQVIVRTYRSAKEFQKDANNLNLLGYSITAVSGGGKHFSAARATVGWVLAGPLGLLFSTGKTPIMVTYSKLPISGGVIK